MEICGLNPQDPETVFPLFRVSYHWIAPLGLLATLTVGAVVGWLFDKPDTVQLDAELFTPAVWRLLPAEAHERKGDSRRRARAAEAPAPSSPLILGHLDKVSR